MSCNDDRSGRGSDDSGRGFGDVLRVTVRKRCWSDRGGRSWKLRCDERTYLMEHIVENIHYFRLFCSFVSVCLDIKYKGIPEVKI